MQSFFDRPMPVVALDKAIIDPAKVIDRKSHNHPGKVRTSEWLFEVPVDYSKPEGGTLRLFARSCHSVLDQDDPELPWLLYLQGGPGLGCKTPLEYGWLASVLEKGYRVLFLDERGTGQSSTITAKTLAKQGDVEKQAEYMKKFRADNIVRDCEAVRTCLFQGAPAEKSKWSVLGVSFGGFVSIAYVSMFPASLVEVFIGGGPCPLVDEPIQVIPRLFEVAARRNEAYYQKYPEDVNRIKQIVKHLKENKVALCTGILSPERFQQLGTFIGLHGGIDYIHNIVQRAWNDLEMFQALTSPTLGLVESSGMANNVIYALLQEPMYCQGKPAHWCADRCRRGDSRFSLSDRQSRIFFTGEAIFADMFESYDELKELKDVANYLSRSSDWPQLYNEAQLARNEVPVYAATAMEDMYVDYGLACNTAAKVKNLKQVISNTWYHDAVETKAAEVMAALFALKEDRID